MLIEILTFSFTKMRLTVSSAQWRPFCLGLNVLNGRFLVQQQPGAETTSCDNIMAQQRVVWGNIRLFTKHELSTTSWCTTRFRTGMIHALPPTSTSLLKLEM